MVAFTSALAVLSVLPALSLGWDLGIYSTQVTCGGLGEWAPDSSRGGVAGATSSCQSFGFNEIHAIVIQDWDQNCEVHIFSDGNCGGDVTHSYSHDRDWPTKDQYTCIVQDQPDFFSFLYVCS
ncbi:hypothetical protein EJ04DRAFT_559782 [Polyplosphaeria fusca]|uniref:Uncharacterized protein n=1 Tax=Polyplosphaeria fusca TaxID=682080 RepID=A0A9P4V8E8_9PLEO|nr:hypothetical protein EJ04DRAFT_559782 [Polyplosphaeria fusca]